VFDLRTVRVAYVFDIMAPVQVSLHVFSVFISPFHEYCILQCLVTPNIFWYYELYSFLVLRRYSFVLSFLWKVENCNRDIMHALLRLVQK